MMDFLDFIRKVAQEKKEQGYVIKGGPGSGWHGPPKGTHGTKGKKGGEGESLIDLGVRLTKLRDKKFKLELDLKRTRYKPKYRRQKQAEVDKLKQEIDELADRKRELARRKGIEA